MNITNASNAHLQSSENSLVQPETKKSHPTKTVNQQTTGADKVTISSQAEAGLRALALPSWANDFGHMRDLSIHTGAIEEGRAFNQMSEQFMADGKLTNAERLAMKQYRENNMPINSQMNAEDQFRIQHRHEFDEFSAIHKTVLEEAKIEHGIVSPEDWQEKVMNAIGHNQELRLTVQQKIYDNPRAVELMSILNIERPS